MGLIDDAINTVNQYLEIEVVVNLTLYLKMFSTIRSGSKVDDTKLEEVI
jgi:hypothetical protein